MDGRDNRDRAQHRAVIVYALLAVVSLWPAVQIALVRGYDVSPWKLAGWGMYSAPRFEFCAMEAYGRADGQGGFTRLSRPARETAAAAERFLTRYRWLRNLIEPDDFAEAVFAEREEWQELRIEVFRPVLKSDSGMIELAKTEIRYERP